MATAYVLFSLILILPVNSFNFRPFLVGLLEGKVAANNFDSNIVQYETNTTELVRRSGYDCEQVDVTTEDGYILKMFHIVTGNVSQRLPILLTHGWMDSSDTFCLRLHSSPAIHLTESGYDVWLGNVRGNKYSRRHNTWDPDADKQFWNFTFHEHGYYDFPAFVDTVLERTGKSQLIIIGHSLGTTNFFVMGSTRPEYNDKIKLSINLSPVFYQQHYHGIVATTKFTAPAAYKALTALGQVELINYNSLLRRIMQRVCTEFKQISYYLCLYVGVFPYMGDDEEQIEPEFVPEIVAHYFTGASVKTIAHFLQFIERKHFGQFDYGPSRNKEVYGKPKAPLYNLTNISTKVVLMVGKNDYLATVPESIMLSEAIPNATYFTMPREKFSHIDFIWGSQMSKYFYPYLDKILKKYQ